MNKEERAQIKKVITSLSEVKTSGPLLKRLEFCLRTLEKLNEVETVSEKKLNLPRVCHTCGEILVTTAAGIKDHAKECKK